MALVISIKIMCVPPHTPLPCLFVYICSYMQLFPLVNILLNHAVNLSLHIAG